MCLLDSEKLKNLEVLLKKRVVGQDHAISEIARILRISCSFLANPRKPIGVFLFVGPTGVGKAELAKTLAEILYGDEERLIQIDMSEFYDQPMISRLIGAPDGDVNPESGSQLTAAVIKQPYSVVLFDEIEKAHPEILRILLQMLLPQILEEGCITDGLGRTVNFRNSVVIMTLNIGSDWIREHRRLGENVPLREERENGVSLSSIRGYIQKELRRRLSRELLNRLDAVVIFDPLSKENLRNMASLMLSKIKVKAEADEKVLDFLVSARYDPALGARPLKRTFQDYVVEPLAAEIIDGHISEKDEIKLGLSSGKITFEIKGGKTLKN